MTRKCISCRERLPLLRAIGVDPGVACTGVAVVELRDGEMRALAANVIRTKKADKKSLRGMRVSADDQRRRQAIWFALHDIVREHRPHGLAVESYAPQPGRGGGNAWKTACVFGLVHGLGMAHGLVCMPFLPQDLKRGLAGRLSASKDDVGAAVVVQVSGLEKFLGALPRGQHEHVTDAAGHAVLGLREMVELRRAVGAIGAIS